ncbi:MbtH family NRPS accessory protein [Xenorhabdus sp. KK7.4]|uniref:MbtH family NRPS accessory protein n=1 Tax=Xenorhabdus sp. KK7.4 TaxID=1851572 RepID=UPI000C04B73B|nr:MbtH family NRPS accessory protein [Xenorhabdus sp. KK7.4]PHM51947.1 MbtH-like protein [Xenorhabdus sp. KK7.4]
MEQLTGNEAALWIVVINSKKQYSVWPDEYRIPIGWMAIGKEGPKAECLEYIAGIWPEPTKKQTDMH